MSERTISLPQSAFDVLQEYKEEWYDKVKELAGDEWEDNGFVFVTETGRHTNPSAVSSWLTRVEEKYGLPHLNAHAFRHSVASALIFAGVDPVSVSRRLGHNQVSTTTNIYAHIMSKADERNAEILDELFWANQSSSNEKCRSPIKACTFIYGMKVVSDKLEFSD